MDNLEKVDKFLETYKLPKLKEEEIENLNGHVIYKEIELVIKNLPTYKSPGQDSFSGEFYQTVKEDLIPIFLKLLKKIEQEVKLLNLFYEARITLISEPDKDII